MDDCSVHGYQNSDIVKVVVAKTIMYRDRLQRKENPIQLNPTNAYSLLSLLCLCQKKEINVLDFGGAAGAHYFLARAILPPDCRINWLVVETSAMASQATKLLACEDLRFVSSLDAAVKAMERIDLLHSSGTLQCVDYPTDYLKKLMAIPAGCVLLNRLGLVVGDHHVITTHESLLSSHGPGPLPSGVENKKVRYPFTFLSENIFFETLSQSHSVIRIFEDTSGIFDVNDAPIKGLGLLAIRKPAGAMNN
jgi:putative methyltransferase (TIGR04325 family)